MTLLSSLLCSLALVVPFHPDSIVSYFNKITKVPQEKVYLQTDKSNYGVGENIWFKGYLVNAISHSEKQVLSNYLYVDLVNQADSVVMSRKIRRQDSIFCGNIKLDATLPAGYYYLRSYTNWMLNEDPAFHYSKLMQIGNSINDDFAATASYMKPDSLTMAALIRFTYRNSMPDHRISIRYICYDGKRVVKKGGAKTEVDGSLRVQYPCKGSSRIHILFDDPTFTYQNDFFPQISSTDYQVTFFPEGGDLQPMDMQQVAFKAQGSNGYSLPVTGAVLNEKGDTVANVKTLYDGMGWFSISPQRGASFYAVLVSDAGVKKSFPLPAIHPSGFNLRANYVGNVIHYEVRKTDDLAWPDTMYVAVHERGFLRYLQAINAQHTVGVLPDNSFMDGIVHILLIDKIGRTINERLIFVKHPNQLSLAVSTDKIDYGKRDKVLVNLNLKDIKGNPVCGNLSVSVIDNSLVKSDSLQGNICSNLLLTSDLKGFIEHPAHYFDPANKYSKIELDLLMLTHGWRRFKLDDFTKDPDLSFKNYLEYGESFSGTVSNLFGKAKNAQITALAPHKGFFAFAKSDEKGRFIIQGIEYPDSTNFVVTAHTAKGGKRVAIDVDTETQPEMVPTIPYPSWNNQALSNDYLQNVRDGYFASGGMKVIHLKEVTVTAVKEPKPGDPNYFYTSMSDHNISGDRLKLYANMSVFDIARTLPGVIDADEDGEQVLNFMRNHKRPLLIINDIPYEEASDYSLLQTINGDQVDRIDEITGTGVSMLGSKGSDGAIVITLKSIDALTNSNSSLNIIRFTPRGYDKTVEFYSPAYDTPIAKSKDNSDFRSTVYWNPRLKADAQGKSSFSFYTNDSGSPEKMIIEGITSNGIPVYWEQVLPVK